MSDADAIDELLVRWQDLRRRGESPSVRALCADHPSLADELRKRIDAFESTGEIASALAVRGS